MKNYVFDTNVLIHDPKSIYRFQDNNVYVPIYVLEELDGLKNDPGERGFSAREAIRAIDDLRTRGKINEGVQIHKDHEFLPEDMPLETSGKLFVYTPEVKAKFEFGLTNIMDNAILQCALNIKEANTSRTILVTMDVSLRVRAEAMDLQVAQYEFQSVDITSLGNGVRRVNVSLDVLNDFYRTKEVNIKDVLDSEHHHLIDENYEINSSLILGVEGTKQSALCRVRSVSGEKIVKKIDIPKHVLGIKPRNSEQSFALDLLLDDSVKLVTIMGKAGCGKTLLTLAAGLYQVIEEQLYHKMLVSRPVVPMGKDIGYLPGSMEEKMDPWMQPFYDNLDFIMMSAGNKKKHGTMDDMFQDGTIQVEPLMSIRGRSIPNQFIIIDEAQNLTPHEIKTIITRCGENTKIVLTGDVFQIDNPYISSSSNGLSVAAKKLRNNHMVGHLALEKGERSGLATLAADKL